MIVKNDGSVLAWGRNDDGQIAVPEDVQSNVTSIGAGGSFSVALKRDGSVVAWGRNTFGQTDVPEGLTGVVQIAAGGSHTVALRIDGTVVAWGRNNLRQTAVPSGLVDVIAIAAGESHSLALKSDGSVVAWGFNSYGQSTVPVTIQGRVKAIAAGGDHTVVLKNDGGVLVWGKYLHGQTNVPQAAQSGVIAIAAGSEHSLALRADGTLVAWGSNNDGQTTGPDGVQGRITTIAAGGKHTVVLAVPTAPEIIEQPGNQVVSAGRSAGFSVKASGYPLYYQWRKDGTNIDGATGSTCSLGFADADQAGRYTVIVSNILGGVTSSVPAVLTVDPPLAGKVIFWGRNDFGQPDVPAPARSGVTAVAIGNGFIVALRTNGTVVAWGDNFHGQTNVPSGLNGVKAIAAGSGYALALKNDGSLVAWGWNLYGPVTVPAAARTGVRAISAHGNVTLALKIDGTVVAWGDNYWGQVTGIPTPPNPEFRYYAEANPVLIGGKVLNGVIAIGAGGSSVALRRDGSVVAWGLNNYGGGDVPGSAQGGVVAVSSGDLHTLALKHDGGVVAWGAGTNNTGRYPNYGQAIVPLSAQSGVTEIAAGGYHNLILRRDEVIAVWGYDGEGSTTIPPAAVGVGAIATRQFYNAAIIVPPAPVAYGQSIVGLECTPVAITLTASGNDGTPLAFAVERFPEHGTLSGTPPEVIYTSAPGFTGVDTFSFTASDSQRRSMPAHVLLNVQESQRVVLAKIETDQLVTFEPDFEQPVLISCNWWNACLRIDGSGSTSVDACGDQSALQYLWFVEPDLVPFAFGATATNCLEVGNHTVILAVTDMKGTTDLDAMTVEVVTAPLAIELLIEKVNESRIARKTKRELVATLKVALNHAGRERLRETQTALRAFERKMRALVTQINQPDAAHWIQWSQAVSDGMANCLKPPRKLKDSQSKTSNAFHQSNW